MSTFLNSPEDVAWLRSTHLKSANPPAFESFALHGNEDSPTQLDLFTSADPLFYTPPVAIYVQDGNGGYFLQRATELANLGEAAKAARGRLLEAIATAEELRRQRDAKLAEIAAALPESIAYAKAREQVAATRQKHENAVAAFRKLQNIAT